MSTRHSKVASSVAMSFSLVLLGMVACNGEDVDAEDEGTGETGGGTSASTSSTPATGGATIANLARGGATATSGAGLGFGGNTSPKATHTSTPQLAAGAAGARPFGGAGMMATGGVASTAGSSSTAPSCVSGRACTAGCSATCLNDASASYNCQCKEGKLDCDVRACAQQVGSCEDGNTCSKDCTATCLGDASTSYTCTCSGGRLSCDTMSCFGDSVCPSTNSDGLACSDTQSTCTPPAGSTETMCFCLFESWLCV